ncbi:EVE domain-containing protein, partial [Candidatus Bathyarchaeota archaeon]|nr:EVE domain-containing protein [Candidatus Bathyarchaeota archaeon]
MVNFWITPTNSEAWALVQEHNVYAFSRKGDRDKIQPGDKAIFYLIGSDPPVFVGIFEIIDGWEESKEPFWTSEKAEGRVIYPWRFRLKALKIGATDARKMSRQLSFIENKKVWPV